VFFLEEVLEQDKKLYPFPDYFVHNHIQIVWVRTGSGDRQFVCPACTSNSDTLNSHQNRVPEFNPNAVSDKTHTLVGCCDTSH
jgi:hypothetical protein